MKYTTELSDDFIRDCKTAIADVIKQGHVSVLNGKCAYRGCDGDKCVVGMMISDEYYTPDIENNTPSDSPVSSAVSRSLGYDLNYDMICVLQELQAIHDSQNFGDLEPMIDEFESNFKNEINDSIDDGMLPEALRQ